MNAAQVLMDRLNSCDICPRRCGIDRTKGKLGYCRAGLNPRVYSHIPHHGEEPPLSGTKGSGAIFFSHCNMRCVYCQNYYFSQLDNGEDVTIESLAGMMTGLQRAGCRNINLVSPAHFLPQILTALETASKNGLDIPIVYNTSGYDSADTIKLLDGIIDIYMPDMRYSNNEAAKKYSDAPDYVENNRASVIEMQRQAGDLALDGEGKAKRGLIIRLLVMPDNISGTKESLKFIKDKVSRNASLSIMSQYYPAFKAGDYKDISRRISAFEYENIVDEAKRLGLNNGWVQEAPIEFDPKFFGTNIEPKTRYGQETE